MKNYMKIDATNRQIIMDKTFAKNAAIYGSEEYARLQDCRRDYPNFSVVTRSIKKNPGKESYKGLTYGYIEKYIMNHENAQVNMATYLQLREIAECRSVRFPAIKKWFLKTYPEVATYGVMHDQPSIKMTKSEEKTEAA